MFQVFNYSIQFHFIHSILFYLFYFYSILFNRQITFSISIDLYFYHEISYLVIMRDWHINGIYFWLIYGMELACKSFFSFLVCSCLLV